MAERRPGYPALVAEHQQRREDEHDEAAPRREQRERAGTVDPRREWTDPEFDEEPEEEPPDQRERGDIGF